MLGLQIVGIRTLEIVDDINNISCNRNVPQIRITSRAVLNFFWPPASRAGKVEKLPALIETYQPEKKNERGTFFVVVHMTAFLAGSLRSSEYGRSA